VKKYFSEYFIYKNYQNSSVSKRLINIAINLNNIIHHIKNSVTSQYQWFYMDQFLKISYRILHNNSGWSYTCHTVPRRCKFVYETLCFHLTYI